MTCLCAVLDVRGLQFASEQNVVAAVLGRRPGVLAVDVNPVAQAATVVFDPGQTSVAELRGWLYSLYVPATGGGDVFYEAATVLASFVLLGHWFEMRARGGANDAIRTLLDLAPPRAVVIRGGQETEIPTAEAKKETSCWCAPAQRSPWMASWKRGRARPTSRWSPGRACQCTTHRARR